MNFLPIQAGGSPIYSSMTLPASSSIFGTHFSHNGIGGFVELPSIAYRNGIPIDQEMNSDGYSSGRRKFGMIVYTAQEQRYFQLRPLHLGSEVTLNQWLTSSNAQKMVWLDPTQSREDFDGLSPTYNLINGSGNPNDAWRELYLQDDFKSALYGNYLPLTGGTIAGSISATDYIYHRTKLMSITTDYTFVSADQNGMVMFNSNISLTATVPNSPFAVGSSINFTTLSAVVFIQGAPGVTIQAADNRNYLRTQYSTGTVLKIDNNVWLLFGDIWRDGLG